MLHFSLKMHIIKERKEEQKRERVKRKTNGHGTGKNIYIYISNIKNAVNENPMGLQKLQKQEKTKTFLQDGDDDNSVKKKKKPIFVYIIRGPQKRERDLPRIPIPIRV